ncbi:hypothetical protein ACFPN1_16130 [Lysobacter yangpyeongensis]|uniref:DUF695 domain-containing protein n=1 Tax=Lysobacter yangpyeongensis TaxID=346182 RepID=A0ABW0SRG7_9GAMM
MRILATTTLATALLGCSGESTMPPGFNEACYGGNYSQYLSGANPIYSATLAVDHPSQPVLRSLLFQLAEKHQLKAFDDGANYNNQFFSVYLCSSKGAFAFVDSRAAGENMVRVTVFSYRESWHPEQFVGDLSAALSSQWPNGLRMEDPSNTTLKNSIL